ASSDAVTQDGSRHLGQPSHDVVVREAQGQNAEPLSQMTISTHVVVELISVIGTVHLNRELGHRTPEVEYVAKLQRLTAKGKPSQALLRQLRPQHLLGRRHPLSQPSRQR